MVHFILLDIEGTTTDIAFVHQVLFPYSAQRLAEYVNAHARDPELQRCLTQVKETVEAEDQRPIGKDEAIDTLLHWIQTDRKHTALKAVQGLIWKMGFEEGHYQGHVYPDVPAALARWRQQGVGLGIYSSGSVQAQQLLFKYSVFGDLTPYFSHYFDTEVGGKKEADSYRNIAQTLGLPSADILFLSDVVAELDAARQACFQVTQLLRSPTLPAGPHPTATDFSSLLATPATSL
jgi:enolase-phosphatase E1